MTSTMVIHAPPDSKCHIELYQDRYRDLCRPHNDHLDVLDDKQRSGVTMNQTSRALGV